MASERSIITSSEAAAGSWSRSFGSRSLTAFATATVLVPGWRCTASMIPRWSMRQAAVLSFCTLSKTRPTSCSRTGEPSR